MSKQIILTCEHAGNEIPKLYRDLFYKNKAVLDTHRGYDIGALELIKTCSEKIKVTPYIHSVTRLLVDLNRSLHNPELFSEFMESLDTEEREKIVKEYYEPHRNSVQNRISELIWNGDHVLHISVHTFTPHLNGIEREADIGLLFDPGRSGEEMFCQRWKKRLEEVSGLKVRFNYPYRGVMDGFTTYLRKQFPDPYYSGVEVEVNQKFVESKEKDNWKKIRELVGETLRQTYKEWN